MADQQADVDEAQQAAVRPVSRFQSVSPRYARSYAVGRYLAGVRGVDLVEDLENTVNEAFARKLSSEQRQERARALASVMRVVMDELEARRYR